MPGDAERGVDAERQRIEKIVVHPAVDDVDTLQAVGRAHVDEVVVDDEVASFDQLDAHLASQKGVLVVRRVVDARRQQHDRRIARPSGASDRSVESSAWPYCSIGRTPYLRNSDGKICFITLPAREHVGHAARHAQVVFEHGEPAVGEAHQVGTHHVYVDVARHLDAAHLAAEVMRQV